MIYTASYSETNRHHGNLISISLYPPKWLSLPQLPLFAPTLKMLSDWKDSRHTDTDWKSYEAAFWELMKLRRAEVMSWLQTLTQGQDMTLACFEKSTDSPLRCHRTFVGQIIQKYRLGCWGGSDVVAPKFDFKVGDRVNYLNGHPWTGKECEIKEIVSPTTALITWFEKPVRLEDLEVIL